MHLPSPESSLLRLHVPQIFRPHNVSSLLCVARYPLCAAYSGNRNRMKIFLVSLLFCLPPCFSTGPFRVALFSGPGQCQAFFTPRLTLEFRFRFDPLFPVHPFPPPPPTAYSSHSQPRRLAIHLPALPHPPTSPLPPISPAYAPCFRISDISFRATQSDDEAQIKKNFKVCPQPINRV